MERELRKDRGSGPGQEDEEDEEEEEDDEEVGVSFSASKLASGRRRAGGKADEYWDDPSESMELG